MSEELDPGAADPAALAQLHPGEPGGNAEPRPAPEPSGDPDPGIKEPDQQRVSDLRAQLSDTSLPASKRAEVREALLAEVDMGEPVPDDRPEPEHREALWETQGTNADGEVLQAVAPEDLGEALPTGSFSEIAPKNQEDLEAYVAETLEGAPDFHHWLTTKADPETARGAVRAVQSLSAAGVPPKLLSDLIKLEHKVSQSGGAAHLSRDACFQSLQAGYGEEGASQRIREAQAVIASLPPDVAKVWSQILDQTGIGNLPSYIERLSEFYRKGF